MFGAAVKKRAGNSVWVSVIYETVWMVYKNLRESGSGELKVTLFERRPQAGLLPRAPV